VFLGNLVVGGALAEELGWRGYLQPLVAGRVGTVAAGVGVGVVWGLWHLPFYLLGADGVVAGFPVPAFLAVLVAWSVLLAVLVRASGGSVLLAVLFHASANTTLGTLGVVDTGRPGLLLTCVAVQVFLVLVACGWYRRRLEGRRDTAASVGA
jgi:membrane protease YdiL (CAAX protease family)